MAQIVHKNVHLTVKVTNVDTRMDGVYVILGLRVIIVPKVNLAEY